LAGVLGLVTYRHGAPTGACSKPHSTESSKEPFLGLECRFWAETKTEGIIGEVLRRQGRAAGTLRQRVEDDQAYGWAKIENDGGGPRRVWCQCFKLAVAASITGFPAAVADFYYS